MMRAGEVMSLFLGHLAVRVETDYVRKGDKKTHAPDFADSTKNFIH